MPPGCWDLLGISAIGAAAAPARIEVRPGSALAAGHAAEMHEGMLMQAGAGGTVR